MKNIILIISFLFYSCTDMGNSDTFVYTVTNDSGYSIKVKAYNTNDINQTAVETILTTDQKVSKTYVTYPPSSHYYGFGSLVFGNKQTIDSVVILYGNSKIQIFENKMGEGCSDERNPLNQCLYGIKKEISFTFTPQDYQNATPCNGNCE